MVNIFNKYIGVKLISVFVFLLCGLALVELTAVSIFASTNNIEIPVTNMHVIKPVVLSLLGIVSALALLKRKKAGKYGLSIWFMIYIVTGAFWTA